MLDYNDMPAGVKVGAAVATAGGIMGVLSVLMGPAAWILWVGVAAVAMLVGIYAWLVAWARKRKAKPLEQGIFSQGSAAPVGVSGAASRARLDDLRKNFETGVAKFKAAGKDLYSLPWYVVVGESGSGKTEAIRHCNVGFPPGLQDELQGTGGTINMNWWFTNYAVLLDTAGRIMFEDVAPGSTSEWREFLKLLRIARKTCPINGLLLVIPADSLIKDTADSLERKGGRIARQLDIIQRELDVRFPVFVVVTKCDLINGFREFFDNIFDPQSQHQILGWSNPENLDAPFKAELIEKHMATVLERLNKRRLGLLVDPVHTEDPSARRTDQVDAMYAFPQSFAALGPRLKRYLEMIFVAGEWATKPLFLRGIYFTSAMREGAALDAELAEVLGVPVESLPEGRVWERERAYFLRDVLMQKVFREKGLVTRAGNAGKQHRRRKIAVLAAGFLGVVALGVMTWLGASAFNESLGAHRDAWTTAKNARWDDRYWSPVVGREFEGGALDFYQGQAPPKDSKMPTGLFQGYLHELSLKPIHVPWIFSLARLSGDLDAKRREAQHVVFNMGVLRPIVDATRAKILTAKEPSTAPATASAPAPAKAAPTEWTAGGAAVPALAALIRLEAAGAHPRPLASDVGASEPLELDAMFRYVLADRKDSYEWYRKNDRDGLQRIFRDMYTSGKASWPPALWQDKASVKEGLKAIDRGVDVFVRTMSVESSPQSGSVAKVRALMDALQVFGQREDALLKLADEFQLQYRRTRPETPQEGQWARKEWSARLAALEEAGLAVDKALAGIDAQWKVDLSKAYEEDKNRATARMREAYDMLITATGQDPSKIPADRNHLQAVCKFLADAKTAQIAAIEESHKAVAAGLLAAKQAYLVVMEADRPWYASRMMAYRDCDKEMRAADGEVNPLDLAGGLEKIDRGIEGAANALAARRKLWASPRLEKAEPVCTFALDLAGGWRRYTMIHAAMARAAKDGVAAPLAKLEVKPLAKPKIPLTRFDGGVWTVTGAASDGTVVSYHPEGARQLLAARKKVAWCLRPVAFGTPGSVYVVDRLGLSEEYKAYSEAMMKYVDGYVEFWTETVFADLKLAPAALKDWGSYQRALKENPALAVNIGLETLGKDILQRALADDVLAPDALPREQLNKVQDRREKLKASQALVATQAFVTAAERQYNNWQKLPADPGEARAVVVEGDPKKDYLEATLGDRLGYVGRFWREMSVRAGLVLLADSYQAEARKALAEVKKFAKFPLVKPGPTGEMTLQQINDARGYLATALGKVMGKDKESGDAEVDERLATLFRPTLPAAELAWAQRASQVAAAIPARGGRCVVLVAGEGQDKEFLNLETRITVQQEGKEKLEGKTEVGTPFKLGELDYPGKDFTVKFFKVAEDQRADKPFRTVTATGAWAAIRLLHAGNCTETLPDNTTATHRWENAELDKDGKTWRVKLILKDDPAKEHPFILLMQFESPLPEITHWAETR